jgi:uncharacterized LabA/DUF88 family protein
MKAERKVALRLGTLKGTGSNFVIPSPVTKDLFSGKTTLKNIKPNDLVLDVRQKGVDMKIGIDIASLSYKKLVDQIVLIAGDADFVPAAKLARTEGIDFILDAMGNNVSPELMEHIDGFQTRYKRVNKNNNTIV